MQLDKFLDYISKEKRYSVHTQTSYKTDLNQFFLFLNTEFGISDPSKVTFKMIRNWISYLLESGLKSVSVNRKISSIKSYFKFIEMSGFSDYNPTLKITSPKTSKRLPIFIEKNNIDNLLDNNFFNNDFEGSRDKLIIELFYFTGIRLSELLNIKISDVNFNNSYVKVLGKRNKERLIPLNFELSQNLKNFISQNNLTKFLFTDINYKKLYSKKVYRIVNYYISKVSSLKKRSPHILRHSFATHMLNNGADINAIKELLGHANLSATQVYTHNSIAKLKSVHNQAHPKA
ncbi:MAG: tyrosine-type recombinase/integrase [Flavobacteriales bacterium]|nr:tyrosine-type recombinase/integrase [Flavobacteriales bacterium]